MTSPQPKDLGASVRQRLMNRSREVGRPFAELLQYYAMERFLYRLSASPRSRHFILKGALMFVVWKAPRSRATMDIDLLGRTSNRVEDVVEAIREICAQVVEPDGLTFDPESVAGARIDEDAEYVGVRVRFWTAARAGLPETALDPMEHRLKNLAPRASAPLEVRFPFAA